MDDLSSETFGGTWPYTPRFFDHDRVKLHYVDEGAGEPVVMLHGTNALPRPAGFRARKVDPWCNPNLPID